MQNYETQYMNLVKRILSEGYKVTGRNGDVLNYLTKLLLLIYLKNFLF